MTVTVKRNAGRQNRSDVKKILLVEDEVPIAINTAEVLDGYGFKVVVAYSAEEAVETAREEAIDLVLMDIDLGRGEKDGAEAAQRILELRNVPVVFVTGHTDPEILERIQGLSRYGVVPKNAADFLLYQAIQMALQLFLQHTREIETSERLQTELEQRRETERRLKFSETFLNSIIDQSPFPIWLSNDKGLLIRLNAASKELFGVSDDSEVVGKYDFHKDDILIEKGLVPLFDEVYTKGKTVHLLIDYDYGKVKHVHVPNATRRTLDCTVFPIKNPEGKVTNAVFQQKDVTDRIMREEELKTALKEKDFLLREINHRIKNNLMTITSLLRLKCQSLETSVDLSDLEHQIDAIRIVHEKLYQDENVTDIYFPDYVQQLLETVFSSFSGGEVVIENRVMESRFSAKTAAPLGLIINELATNAIKHAFPGPQNRSESGKPAGASRFRVDMTRDDGRNEYVLRISNNGPPLPEDIDIKSPKTLGLLLVSELSVQLEGKLEVRRAPHPEFIIRFPSPEHRPQG